MKEWARKFYAGKAWQKVREGYIHQRYGIDGGMCEVCHERPGYIVHHKKELTPMNISNPEITLNYSNLQYVCKKCHDRIHGYCGRENKAGRIVMFDKNGEPKCIKNAQT